jgi:hypothetical protein
MINKRIQNRAAKRQADEAERYQRLAASAPSTKPLHEWATLRQMNEWSVAVRNQLGLTPDDEIPMGKLCSEMRVSRHINIDISKLDQAARVRLFSVLASILTH